LASSVVAGAGSAVLGAMDGRWTFAGASLGAGVWAADGVAAGFDAASWA
jgi:hypothetical protein